MFSGQLYANRLELSYRKYAQYKFSFTIDNLSLDDPTLQQPEFVFITNPCFHGIKILTMQGIYEAYTPFQEFHRLRVRLTCVSTVNVLNISCDFYLQY